MFEKHWPNGFFDVYINPPRSLINYTVFVTHSTMAFHWVDFSFDKEIPKNAVVCGVNAEDKTKIYIGRVFYQGDLCIVSYFSGLGKGYFPYHGGIIEVYEFQMLVNYLPEHEPIWSLTGYGHLPRNAVQVGYNSRHDPSYIGRVNFKGTKIPAKYFPSKNRCYFVAGTQEGNWASCEILLHRIDGYDWVVIDKDLPYPYPQNYVVVAQEADGDDVAVGYCNYKNEQTLVKIVPNKRTATIAYYGEEIPVNDSVIHMLVHHGRKELRWVNVRKVEDYPTRDVVQVGETADGRVLHVGRYKRNGIYVPGKIIKREKTINIPINGKEEIYTHNFEVLILPTAKDLN